jgi:asparagine synthase (glutamine-hydrolysing)
MCGIAGIWNSPAPEGAETALARMLAAMRHRGPDGEGVFAYPGGAAGMVRLALVDLTARGQQPLWSPDKRTAILFNGEIYNFREHRARLEKQGYPFQSTTDTEVILALYLEQGMKFLDALRGMYAIALFDWREAPPAGPPELLLARDSLGIKPLYIAEPSGAGREVVFASEIRPLLASGRVEPRIDAAGLVDYLASGFVLQPRTMLEKVRMLPAGTFARFAPRTAPQQQTFWRMPDYQPQNETLDQAADRCRAVLDESIRLHSLADAPVGAFLSGGVDSTGVVGLMRRQVSQLHTYTLRYPEFPHQDEAAEATEAAREFGSQHTIVDVTGGEVAQFLPRFAGDLDQPSIDGLNTWIVSRGAAHDVKGVLSGLGGDEWFAGYPTTRRMLRSQKTFGGKIQSLLARASGPLRQASSHEWWLGKLHNLSARRNALATWIQAHTVFREDQVARLLRGRPIAARDARHLEMLGGDDGWRGETPLGLACLLDHRVYMQSQLLRDADAVSMAHSLELRVPLVDLEVVKFSRSCRDDFKMSQTGGASGEYAASGAKRVLIHALRDVLPEKLKTRVKKGFALPLERWLQGPLAPLLEATTNRETIAARGILDPAAVQSLATDRESQRPGICYPLLWSLCVFELWCQATLDRASEMAVRPLQSSV